MALGSCSSSFTNHYEYDVFLSFRGEDTRLGFTGHLYKALDNRGIRTFIDDEKLQSGYEITPELVNAIQQSRIAIIILSKLYATSSFCLHELATILDCLNGKDQLVLPVFYKIDPRDVRHQKGSYAEAMARHEERYKAEKEKLEKWKNALHRIANLLGYHIKDGDEYEYKIVEKIVERVSSKINRIPLHVAEYPVGLESQVHQVMKILDVGCGVHMIGIHGMGGIGKSTLARAVYNSLIADNFDGVCFLKNVREESEKHGLQHLQRILLSKIVGEKDINLECWEEGISKIESRLKSKKVLLVLDDVDKPMQLKAIAGRCDWFGPGSRIIITTRNKQLLATCEVIEIYEMKKLNMYNSLQLLAWVAFKKEKVDPRYEESVNFIVKYASGLPLALEVIGSSLIDKSVAEWESAIEQYRRIPKKEILEILKVSFRPLEEEEKSVFLDIACCFNGYKLKEIENILCAHYDHNITHHIGILVEKSLMKLDYGRVRLHDLIEQMGKDIVRQESPEEPEERSRLWSWEDIIQVLEDNIGTSKIKLICLDFHMFGKKLVEWDGKAFKNMQKLKTLIVKNVNFSKGPKYLPNSLRVLEWWEYPSYYLPSDFQPKKLVKCKLPKSSIKKFEFRDLSKKFVKVRVLNFDHCQYLTQIPNLSGFPNLEELSFQHCDELVEVHKSIGSLCKLKILNSYGCKMLESFPYIHLISLEKLDISWCSILESFPKVLGTMENIRELDLRNIPIKELSFSIYDSGIVKFSSSVVMMPKLTPIEALHCTGRKQIKLEDEENMELIVSSKASGFSVAGSYLNDDFFPRQQNICFPNLQKLWVYACHKLKTIFTLTIVRSLLELVTLTVNDCNELQEIFSFNSAEEGKVEQIFALPYQLVDFSRLQVIEIEGCKKLKRIFSLSVVRSFPELKSLTANDCNELEEIFSFDSEDMREVEQISTLSDHLVYFPRLEYIHIARCNRLKTIVSLSIVRSLPELQRLTVNDCDELEKIFSFDSEEVGNVVRISALSDELVYFPKLEYIHIEKCNKLKTIVPLSIVRSLPKLVTLTVIHCYELEEIFSFDSEEVAEVEQLSTLSDQLVYFPILQTVKIEGCNKLKTIFFLTILGSMPELERLTVNNCNELEEIFSFHLVEAGDVEQIYALFDQLVYFPRLGNIHIERCNKLKTMVSLSIVKSLPKLVTLTVSNCDELEEIFSFDSEKAGELEQISALSDQPVYFPRLEVIKIEECNKLKIIFSLTIFRSLPELQKLTIDHCNELQEIISFDSEEAAEVEQISTLSDQLVYFPKLVDITISSCKKLKTIFSLSIVRSLPKLMTLRVSNCKELEETLSFHSEEAGEVELISANSNQLVCFPSLWDIEITLCDKLKTVFSLTIVRSLPELRRLIVFDCNELEEIFSFDSEEAGEVGLSDQLVYFPNLNRIGIGRCDKLRSIVSLSIVRSLPKLVTLTLIRCNELKENFSFDSDEAREAEQISPLSDQLVYFSTLEYIYVQRCNKLKTIVSLSVVRSFPKLVTLTLIRCNQLKEIFSFDSDEAGEAEQISPPSDQLVYFPTLEYIHVEKCNKLKTIISLSNVRSLSKLVTLIVWNCNELVEIFSFNSEDQVCLQNIYSLRIKECNKLKCIFPHSLACHSSSLERLVIEYCSELEQIVKFEDQAITEEEGERVAVDENHHQLLFPNIKDLELKALPNLTGTFPGHKPQNCLVEDCPKYLRFT